MYSCLSLWNSPSNEWQDQVTSRINSFAASRNTLIGDEDPVFGEGDIGVQSTERSTTMAAHSTSEDDATRPATSGRPVLSLRPLTSQPTTGPSSSLLTPHSAAADRSEPENLSMKRQRRRLEGDNASDSHDRSPSTPSVSGRSRSPVQYALLPPHPALLSSKASASSLRKGHASLSPDAGGDGDADIESAGGEDELEGEDELAVAVGQLSINEDQQVRYHGKASGLHLLGIKERVDGRNDGGIWYVFFSSFHNDGRLIGTFRRFPKARVWPPLPATVRTPSKSEEDWMSRLPDVAEQEHLLELYFTYVHPALPILHKKSFMENYRQMCVSKYLTDV